jgi:hypothetical protein
MGEERERMPSDSDAEQIRRTRERRRAEERSRIDREHRRRELEASRLRRVEGPPRGTLSRGADPGAGDRSTEPVEASASGEPTAPSPAAPSPPTPVSAPTPRAIGSVIESSDLHRFLALDPAERFDIVALNGVHFLGLAREADSNEGLLADLVNRSETLMKRVKRELDDPLSAGAFLREQVLAWFRTSHEEKDWPHRMPGQWAGIFAESRITGGKLQPWLNVRLGILRDEAMHAAGLRLRVRRGISRSHDVEALLARTPAQLFQAEAAQAILDDLATHPRREDEPLPLVRLSELAQRRQVPTVNEALAVLFSSPDNGPFIVLHPNRYPDCHEVVIRPPAPSAAGAALAYTLFAIRPGRRGAAGAIGPPLGAGARAADVGPPTAEELMAGTESLWALRAVPDALWRQLMEDARRERRRLEAPPKEYRTLAAYAKLREQLLAQADLRVLFLAVKWRGRPAGLALVVALLSKGALSPEVATDHEYLDAELNDLDPASGSGSGGSTAWNFSGWRVRKEGNHRDGFQYRAERVAA